MKSNESIETAKSKNPVRHWKIILPSSTILSQETPSIFMVRVQDAMLLSNIFEDHLKTLRYNGVKSNDPLIHVVK